MSITNRRTFMLHVVVGGSAIAASQAMAQAAPMVVETDKKAASLGYKADSAKVDLKAYPAHKATQLCSNCMLYQGQSKAAAGGCAIFPGQQVSAKGWCSAYQPKPA